MNRSFRRYLQHVLPYVLAGGILAGFYLIWLIIEYPEARNGLLFIILYLWVFFSLASFFTWTRFLSPRIGLYTTRWKIFWLLGSLLVGCWLTDNIPIPLPGTGALQAVFFLCAGVGIGLLLFTLSAFFVARFRPPNPVVQRRFRWLAFALPMIAAWIVYLLAFWPGMMSADSLDQWGQVLSGRYNDHHPAFHSFTIWLLTRLAETPAIVALAQIVALALVAGAILAFVESLGVAPFWVWTASIMFAISPVNGTMVNTLWKDIPYSTAMLGLTYLILRLAVSKGRWIEGRGRWLLLGLAAALVPLFRHNGLAVVLVMFPILLLAYRQQWKPIAFAFAFSMALYYGMVGPVYQLAKVEKTSVLMESATSVYNIAAAADPGSQVDAIFQSMNPLSNSWQCSVISPLGKASLDDGVGHTENLLEKTINLVKYAPSLIAYNYRCNRSLVWIIWDPNGEVRNPSHAEYWIDANGYGITPGSKIPVLQTAVKNFVSQTAHDPSINWLVWRPALYLYLFLLVVVFTAMRQKNAWILTIAVPVLLQSIAVTFIPTLPNFRYHYFVYLLAIIIWPILFMPTEYSASTQISSEPLESKNP